MGSRDETSKTTTCNNVHATELQKRIAQLVLMIDTRHEHAIIRLVDFETKETAA